MPLTISDESDESDKADEFVRLSLHFAERRRELMKSWRGRVDADIKLGTGKRLPRSQLEDHLPSLLRDFEQQLARLARPGASTSDEQVDAEESAAAHGLHRWQQGFDLSELIRELGLLNECMVAAFEALDDLEPALSMRSRRQARRLWARVFSDAAGSSANQFFELRQLEAATHIEELEGAVVSLKTLERRQAELWREATHDLRGSLGIVASSAQGLAAADGSPSTREAFLAMLGRNVRSLHRLLEDLTDLARLQSGHEQRHPDSADAAVVIRELCEALQPMAREHGLYLRCEGPDDFAIEADAIKLRRIVQNLVINAVKYTRQGGVDVKWGFESDNEKQRWFVKVADTGPGFHGGPGSQIVQALSDATELSDCIDQPGGKQAGNRLTPRPVASPTAQDLRPVNQQPGEGIGLSIVKGLCELLDATLAVESEIGVGTVFMISFPMSYTGSDLRAR